MYFFAQLQYFVDDTLINGREVNWTYSDGSTINSSWNGNILPGQTVTFGMQGKKGSGNAELPQLQGDLCTR